MTNWTTTLIVLASLLYAGVAVVIFYRETMGIAYLRLDEWNTRVKKQRSKYNTIPRSRSLVIYDRPNGDQWAEGVLVGFFRGSMWLPRLIFRFLIKVAPRTKHVRTIQSKIKTEKTEEEIKALEESILDERSGRDLYSRPPNQTQQHFIDQFLATYSNIDERT